MIIVRTGDTAMELLKTALGYDERQPDPRVYDYRIMDGAVLIHRATGDCLYIKHEDKRTIALQGTPEELATYRQDMEIVNWDEVEEMVAWAPKVPRL